MRTIGFVKQFIRRPQHVGAVAPSSKFLAQRVMRVARVSEANAIVEFGPGNGCLTEVILQTMKPGAQFFAIEINPDFVKAVQKRCPGANVIHDSAENTRKHLEAMGLDGCDAIVSGLPWTLFNGDLQDRLLDAVYDVLRPGGRFVTFMYLMSPFFPSGKKFEQRLRKRFSKVSKTRLVWRNVPPAFAYCVEKQPRATKP